jgi:hypothetical protein
MSDIVIESSIKPAVIEEKLIDAAGQHIVLLEDCVLALVGDNISHVDKRISYEDFSAIIGTVLNRKTDEQLQGFQLPSNCFYYAVSGTTIQLSCYYVERVADVHLGTAKYTIKTPNIVVSHSLVKHNSKTWKHAGARYFCTDAKVNGLPKNFIFDVNHAGRIFTSPFPNTYSEGAMCYGSNSMPSMFTDNNLRGLQWYYEFLFESPFNNDLGLRGVATEPSISSWFSKLADAAKTNGPFPYTDLRGYTKTTI